MHCSEATKMRAVVLCAVAAPSATQAAAASHGTRMYALLPASTIPPAAAFEAAAAATTMAQLK